MSWCECVCESGVVCVSGEGEDVSELVVYWCECVCEGGAVCV